MNYDKIIAEIDKILTEVDREAWYKYGTEKEEYDRGQEDGIRRVREHFYFLQATEKGE